MAHACEVPNEALFGRAALDRDLARYRREILVGARREIADHLRSVSGPGPLLRVVVRCGSPREVVLDVAQTRRADLIVLGVHGRRSPLQRLLLGSVAENVLRGADCDVLIARPG